MRAEPHLRPSVGPGDSADKNRRATGRDRQRVEAIRKEASLNAFLHLDLDLERRLERQYTRMTLDVYAHVAPESEEKAAGAVAAAIAAAIKMAPIGHQDLKTRLTSMKRIRRNRLRRKGIRWWAREVSNL